MNFVEPIRDKTTVQVHIRQLSPRGAAFGVTPNDRRPTLENPSGVLHRGG